MLSLLAERSILADQVVTNLSDGGPGSLRQAILNAAPGDTIRFDERLGPQIPLTNGELTVSGNLTIIGPGMDGVGTGALGLMLNGNTNSRIFHFLGGSNALLNLTIVGGYSSNAGGGILNEALGSLILRRCNVVTNSTDQAGGGLANYGNLTVDSCTFAGNVAGALGGGIYNSNALLATNSTFTGNRSTLGAGIYNLGGFERFQNCTLAGNLASGTGGGISSGDNPPALATNYLCSTIVAANYATNNPDLDGGFTSLGYNLVGAYTGGGNLDPTNQDLFGTLAAPLDPRLGPLGDNGGRILTMGLFPDSPAIDQGNAGSLVRDQRGWPRKYDYRLVANPPGGDGSDIGAFELSPPSPPLTLDFGAGYVVLSWPTNASRFRLQTTTTLPPGQWVDWTGPLVIMADQYVATDNNPTGARYFRLLAPFYNQTGLPANITTLTATALTTNSAILVGRLIPGGSALNCWFQYGPSTKYGQTTPVQLVGSATNSVVIYSSISGLTPGTRYHYRFVISNGNGVSFAQDQSFTTLLAPVANTLAATQVTSNSAVLNGTVNPEGNPTVAWFVLFSVNPATNSVTNAQTLGNGTNLISISQPLSGLTPGTTYYFYTVSSNNVGRTAGNTLAFTVPLGATTISNLITAENSLPGTTDWKLTNPVTVGTAPNSGDRDWPTLRTHVIEGYASATSVNKGEWLTFYVSTISPTYSLEIFRMGFYGGLGGRRMPNSSWFNLPGADQPTPPIQVGGLIECNWQPTYLTGSTNGSFQVPLDWASGIYVVKLTASLGKQNYIIFVVRDDSRNSPYLMQSSVTTYQAYNMWGGRSYYYGGGSRVSFDRPYVASSHPGAAYGNGAGQFFTWEEPPGIVPQEPTTWECNMVRWLESEGYDVTYCTDIDVHRDPSLLLSHNAFLSVGHDEYWSASARTNVETARDLGVHLGFFAGNTVWKEVRFDSDSQSNALRTMSFVGWYNVLGWYPESLVGGTYTGICDADMQTTGQCPPWLADQTDLLPGTTLGRLAGYEVNGFEQTTNHDSMKLVPPDTAVVFTSGAGKSIVYTARTSGATVFSAATIQWSWGLDGFTVDGAPAINPPRSARISSAVQQVTRNVLRRFLDSTRMAADLVDGEYTVQSASAYPRLLICDNQGASNAPVTISPDAGWATTNNQAVWIIARYSGARPPCIGPYKAASDQWYTIRNKQNGQSLIVGNGGVPNSPVIVIGDTNGYWGEAPDNLQKMWRIWHYTANNDHWYLLQNVASGQLLIATNPNAPGSSVAVYGDNGGWGETEQNPQKMWILARQ